MTGKISKGKDYYYLIEKVKNKLSRWRENHLSFIGRVTLAKSMLEALPTYIMMSTAMAKYCLKDI